MVETGRRGPLEDLRRLRAGVDDLGRLLRMELLLTEPWRGLLSSHLSLNRVARVVLLAVWDVGQRDLLGRLGHPNHQLLCPRGLGGVPVALHEPHEEFRVAVKTRTVLRHTAMVLGLARHGMALCY